MQYASTGVGKAGKGKSDLPKRIFSDRQNKIYNVPFYTGSNIQKGGWHINHNIKIWFRSRMDAETPQWTPWEQVPFMNYDSASNTLNISL